MKAYNFSWIKSLFVQYWVQNGLSDLIKKLKKAGVTK